LTVNRSAARKHRAGNHLLPESIDQIPLAFAKLVAVTGSWPVRGKNRDCGILRALPSSFDTEGDFSINLTPEIFRDIRDGIDGDDSPDENSSRFPIILPVRFNVR